MLFIITLILLVCLMIFLFFYKKNNWIKRSHYQQVLQLQQELSLHKTQINFRLKRLQTYNFERYNLSESLQVQSEINLN